MKNSVLCLIQEVFLKWYVLMKEETTKSTMIAFICTCEYIGKHHRDTLKQSSNGVSEVIVR